MPLSVSLSIEGDTTVIELSGELDAKTAPDFHRTIEKAAGHGTTTVEIRMAGVGYMASAGLRSLVFAQQKVADDVTIKVVGAIEPVSRTIRTAGLDRSIVLSDE
ncbi:MULTISPECIES: STAS domain-containing protein [Streptomyces]|uniref:Anti-sigma factor antagonist n=1 Tax=Streptomyces yangpuensis TaxID=1648182 RepID=A0ABY5PTR7_9ACTN|nr:MULTISPECIES: STAS domain-containing protein [Streptomyces]MBZ9594812.1 STAS domain-containing protein [Streptomyces erythrochromogenes]UUY46865.1 STAS domain-containing protein [Streptomyces yangpuensis]WKV75090.1 STAS domain-containing protein [Streptomyces sp. PCS3-D2]